MFLLYRLLRNLIKALASDAAPWQLFLGTFLGTLLGFLPIFPLGYGPSPLALILIALVFILNVHLATVFLFLGVTKLLTQVLHGPALLIGDSLHDMAANCADIPFLNASLWSHTGYLGLTVLGFCFAPLFAILMYRFALYFRLHLRDKLTAKMKAMRAGQIIDKPWLVRPVCWFFGL